MMMNQLLLKSVQIQCSLSKLREIIPTSKDKKTKSYKTLMIKQNKKKEIELKR